MSKFYGAVAGAMMGAALAVQASWGATTNTFIDRMDPNDLRVATYNVFENSVFSTFEMPTVGSRKDRFMRMAAKIDPDVWCFQEMYGTTPAAVKQLLDAAQPLGNAN